MRLGLDSCRLWRVPNHLRRSRLLSNAQSRNPVIWKEFLPFLLGATEATTWIKFEAAWKADFHISSASLLNVFTRSDPRSQYLPNRPPDWRPAVDYVGSTYVI